MEIGQPILLKRKSQRSGMFVTATSPRPHNMNKTEDYGMKAAEFIGKGKQAPMAAFFALHPGKVVVGEDNARHREVGERLRPGGPAAETADDF